VPVPRADGGESVHATPDLKLSEEAFPAGGAVAAPETDEVEVGEPVVEAEAEDDEPAAEPVDEPQAGASEDAPVAEADDDASADEPEAEETS
jgi:hypothetical protein